MGMTITLVLGLPCDLHFHEKIITWVNPLSVQNQERLQQAQALNPFQTSLLHRLREDSQSHLHPLYTNLKPIPLQATTIALGKPWL